MKNSIAYEKMQTNLKFILSLSEDDLLFNYRKNAGISTGTAKGLTGWELYGAVLSGHYLGHYLSSCAISYATYKERDAQISKKLLKKIQNIVDALETCQKKLGEKDDNFGFLGAFPKEHFDLSEQLKFDDNHYVPYYKYQKMLSGLCCVYQLTGNEKALNIAMSMADYIINRFEKLSDELIEKMLNTKWYNNNQQYEFHMEFGGMHFALLKLYELTGREKYKSLANKFRRKWFEDMLKSGEDKLGFYSLHSNTELSCVKGLIDDYKLNGNPTDIKYARNFMDMVEDAHTFVTGGISGTSAYPPPANYGGELFDYPNMFYKHTLKNSGESCCSHALNEMSSDLFALTGDMKYADNFEKRYFNAVYSQQRLSDCGYVYNLCAKNGAKKNFSVHGFYCCNASGIETHANLCHDVCYKTQDSIVITQYIPMVIEDESKGVKIVQYNDLFGKQSAVFEIECEKEKQFTLVLRLPKWSNKKSISVNGQICEITDKDKIEITRIWENGDRVELLLPFDITLYSLPDRFDRFAVYYGPFLMAYRGEEKVISLSKREFLEYAIKAMENGEYVPLMNIGDEEYNLFTVLPKENKYETVCSLNKTGGKFISSGEKWYIKISYNPTKENPACFDILLNGKVCFTQSFLANGEDYLEYVIYPIGEILTGEINLSIAPKIYEGNNFFDISVIKSVSVIKAV